MRDLTLFTRNKIAVHEDGVIKNLYKILDDGQIRRMYFWHNMSSGLHWAGLTPYGGPDGYRDRFMPNPIYGQEIKHDVAINGYGEDCCPLCGQQYCQEDCPVVHGQKPRLVDYIRYIARDNEL